jgi:hypothetical protein
MPPEALVVEIEDPFPDDPDPSPVYLFFPAFHKFEIKLFFVELELLSSL